MENTIVISVISVCISLGTFYLTYKRDKFETQKKQYELNRMAFNDNQKDLTDYAIFLFNVIMVYKNSIEGAQYDASGGIFICNLSYDELLKSDKVIKGESEVFFGGISKKDIKKLKSYITKIPNNLYVLQYNNLLIDTEIEVYKEIQDLSIYLDGVSYDISIERVDYVGVYDTEKKILKKAIKDLEQVEKYLNDYSGFKIKLL